MPEIVQYFVKGEFQPPTTIYVVPTGETPLHEGRSTNYAYHHALPPSRTRDHHDGGHHEPHRDHAQQSDFPHPVPGESFSDVEGTKAEAGKEQVSAPPARAPAVHHEEREHKPEQPRIEHSWDAQRLVLTPPSLLIISTDPE